VTVVKVSTMFPYSPFVRQTPGSLGRWGNCQFMVDHDDLECDYWVVYGTMRDDVSAHCPPENTILLDDEPPDIRKFQSRYIDQFGTVISCQPQISHPRLICRQQGHPWHVGINRMNEATILDYDALTAITEIAKPKLLSVMCSAKSAVPGHRLRLAFLDQLRKHFGDQIDIFGRGFCPVGDKWEAVAPYKYHIAMENSCVPHYMSEKLTDSFLAGSYPLYHGCPNVAEYFSTRAYTPIDINKPELAIDTIEQVIENNLYEDRLDDIWESRELVLNRYNMFAMLADIFHTKPAQPRQWVTIRPDRVFHQSPSCRYHIKNMAQFLRDRLSPGTPCAA